MKKRNKKKHEETRTRNRAGQEPHSIKPPNVMQTKETPMLSQCLTDKHSHYGLCHYSLWPMSLLTMAYVYSQARAYLHVKAGAILT